MKHISLSPFALVVAVCINVLVLWLIWAAGSCEQPICDTIGAAWRVAKNNAPLLSALVASVALMITTTYSTLTAKQTRLANSARLVLDFWRDFNTKERRAQRREYANALQTNADSVDLRKESPVLDFFEDIAHLTNGKIIELDMVWSHFGWWLECYYVLSVKPIERLRNDSGRNSFFIELQKLNPKLAEIRMAKEGKALTEANLKQFLEEEKNIG